MERKGISIVSVFVLLVIFYILYKISESMNLGFITTFFRWLVVANFLFILFLIFLVVLPLILIIILAIFFLFKRRQARKHMEKEHKAQQKSAPEKAKKVEGTVVDAEYDDK